MSKRKNHNSETLVNTKLGMLLVLSVVVSSFSTFMAIPSPKHNLKALAYLPLPQIGVTILPDPLVAPTVTSSVLGAETIDPRDIVTYVNEERMKRGIRPLRVNATLTKAAEMRANVILKHQNFSHQDPFEKIQLDTVLPLLKYSYKYASENIGMGDSSGRAFVTGFMNSPSHRANLLDPRLVETGVAIVTGPYKQYYVNIAVHLFAEPWDQTANNGYTNRDEEEYKKLLVDIGKQLAETKKMKEKDPTSSEFYDRWERLLIRQQEIISNLSHAVQNDQVYGREMIALIKEYNSNWASVPIP